MAMPYRLQDLNHNQVFNSVFLDNDALKFRVRETQSVASRLVQHIPFVISACHDRQNLPRDSVRRVSGFVLVGYMYMTRRVYNSEVVSVMGGYLN